jgi:hypothetical protein
VQRLLMAERQEGARKQRVIDELQEALASAKGGASAALGEAEAMEE